MAATTPPSFEAARLQGYRADPSIAGCLDSSMYTSVSSRDADTPAAGMPCCQMAFVCQALCPNLVASGFCECVLWV